MIEVRDAGVTVDGVTLLSPISVNVTVGETLVVRGRNGSGKSTLLRLLAGAQRPTTGQAFINDLPVSGRDAKFRRTVSAMIGLPAEAPDLTLADHLGIVAATWFDDASAAQGITDELVTALGLGALTERFPHELSSGQRQLFGLALILARPFEVLMLDEPEQRLDSEHLAAVIQVLRGLQSRGRTLVVATHSEELTSSIEHRRLQLDESA
ncbi:ATP-binding cassette domain-containing protein [uncultured Agrococcus sp.]|uniref:ABC transporter ATP-binding protein n=1 Tax=uncultured Agrococcus sp. TaxID=382258 RepID=UPI0025D2F5A5|nr:ATP-binding cassette domain-containing protein [uncultured Agrococcus sp.]